MIAYTHKTRPSFPTQTAKTCPQKHTVPSPRTPSHPLQTSSTATAFQRPTHTRPTPLILWLANPPVTRRSIVHRLTIAAPVDAVASIEMYMLTCIHTALTTQPFWAAISPASPCCWHCSTRQMLFPDPLPAQAPLWLLACSPAQLEASLMAPSVQNDDGSHRIPQLSTEARLAVPKCHTLHRLPLIRLRMPQ